MYVILVYDVEAKRCNKMLKLCRRYLSWIQNSTLEGEISEVKLKELLLLAQEFIDPSTDSIIVFKSKTKKWLEKQIIGAEKMSTDNFF